MDASVRRRAVSWATAFSLALGIVATSPLPAQAAPYSCPSGWTSVTNNPINNVSVFCYLPNSASFPNDDDVHVVKAWDTATAQYTRLPSNPNDLWGATGDSSDPNPEFLKKPVGDHLEDYKNVGAKVMINGIHFDCLSECDDSSLSFPTFRGVVPWTNLRNAGSNNMFADRECIGWGNGEPGTYDWTNTDTSFADVQAAYADCGYHVHRIVGADPDYVADPYRPRTYIGYDLDASPDQLCFLVGGSMTNAEAVDYLEDFNCEGMVQLDGGASSQLSYIDPDTGQRENPVNGPFLYEWRPVPHYIAVFG